MKLIFVISFTKNLCEKRVYFCFITNFLTQIFNLCDNRFKIRINKIVYKIETNSPSIIFFNKINNKNWINIKLKKKNYNILEINSYPVQNWLQLYVVFCGHKIQFSSHHFIANFHGIFPFDSILYIGKAIMSVSLYSSISKTTITRHCSETIRCKSGIRSTWKVIQYIFKCL